MRYMITASLLLNIVVLIPVCVGIASDATWAQVVYGGQSPARGIVLALYSAIGAVSLVLLFQGEPRVVAVLLALQIFYKLLTVFTVGTSSSSVVVANVCIAVFHSFTLFLIWRETSGVG